jgi:hypothetical protein
MYFFIKLTTYKVNDRVELFSEPKWLQDWDPTYPELKNDDKHMTNYFFHLCIPLFKRVSEVSTIEWE